MCKERIGVFVFEKRGKIITKLVHNVSRVSYATLRCVNLSNNIITFSLFKRAVNNFKSSTYVTS